MRETSFQPTLQHQSPAVKACLHHKAGLVGWVAKVVSKTREHVFNYFSFPPKARDSTQAQGWPHG